MEQNYVTVTQCIRCAKILCARWTAAVDAQRLTDVDWCACVRACGPAVIALIERTVT